jgi:cytochrome o ubiquinol oxidase operon protein cyoD
VLALAYGLMVVFLVFVGSIWIMDHLSNNMMSMEQMKAMQF